MYPDFQQYRYAHTLTAPGRGLFALRGGPVDTIDVDARLTATQAAAYVRLYRPMTVQGIVNWRNRGHLQQGEDGKYRLLDVAKAEHATRRRARRH